LLLNTGCIHRTLQIDTNPPGAKVWLNGEECGTTPVEVPFTSYGKIDVFLMKEDYAARREVVHLRPPWYAVFPLDFFSDVLYPGNLHDHQLLAVELQSLESPDTDALEERALEFRESSRRLLEHEAERRGTDVKMRPLEAGGTSDEMPRNTEEANR
jgi:hypothetical protein